MYFHAYNLEVSVQKWNPQGKNQTHTHTPQQKRTKQKTPPGSINCICAQTVSMIPLASIVLSAGLLPSA